MSIFRVARPGEFTFKRDSAGVETVEHQGLIIGNTAMRPLGPVVFLRGGITQEIVVDQAHEAADLARSAGFWSMGTPAPSMSPVSVTVQV